MAKKNLVKPPKMEDFKKDFAQARTEAADNIGGKVATTDSFSNFAARLGIQTGNITAGNYYNLGPYITRNRIQLEAAYRDNWLVGKIIDCIAEDMTKDGITMISEMSPDDISNMQVAISEFQIWKKLCSAIKWARLYGGALAVMLIDGANYEKPLNIETVRKDSFKGLVVLDRWMVQPTMGDLITDLNSDIGKPKFYEALPGVSVFPSMKIHHTRCLRFEGIELPYYQQLFENLWGLSVIERMLDRLMAFDSATLGAAQLLYKAYLRVLRMKDFRQALAAGGKDETALIKQMQLIRAFQTNEGFTVLDKEDEFDVHSYSFSGISDMLQQFGQQVSGSEGIPLVRLFGQSPAGFSTGETDVRNYYDEVHKRQENDLRPNMEKLLAVMSMSRLGHALPDDFEFDFVPLWQMSETEKAQIAAQDSATITGAVEANMISKKTGMKELVQLSRITGRFTNITEEEIESAEDTIPSAEELMPQVGGEEGLSGADPKPEAGEAEPSDDPNERMGAADPDLTGEGKAKTGDRKKVSWKDAIFNFFKGRGKSAPSGSKEYVMQIYDKVQGENIMEYFRASSDKEAVEVAKQIARRDYGTMNFKLSTKDEFKEEDHPRKNSGPTAGQFTKKGQEGAESGPDKKGKEKGPGPEKSESSGKVSIENSPKLGIKDETLKNTFSGISKQAKVEVTPMRDGAHELTAEFTGDDGKSVGSFDLNISKDGHAHLEFFQLDKSLQGKDSARKVITDLEEKVFKEAKVKEFALFADISVGRYAWARMGFDFADEERRQECIAGLKTYVDTKIAALEKAGHFGKATADRMRRDAEKKIASVKTAADISEFTIPGLAFDKSDLKVQNRDVPDKAKMHIGKAYMLDGSSKGMGAWEAVKKLKGEKK